MEGSNSVKKSPIFIPNALTRRVSAPAVFSHILDAPVAKRKALTEQSLRLYYRYRLNPGNHPPALVVVDDLPRLGTSAREPVKIGNLSENLDEAGSAADSENVGMWTELLHWGAWKFIELTQDELKKRQELGKGFDLSNDTKLGLKLTEQVFLCDGSVPGEIEGEARKYSERLVSEGKKHIVLRTGGIIELGTDKGVAGVVPVYPGLFSFGAGLGLKTALVYEFQSTHLEEGDVREMLKQHIQAPPLTGSVALGLKEGSRAKFTAVTSFKSMAVAGLGPEAGVQSIRVGASGAVEVISNSEKVVEIEVIRLAGSRVRVALRTTDDAALDFSTFIRAGLSWGSTIDSKITWGNGLLLAAAKNQDQPTIDAWFKDLTSVNARLTAATGKLTKDIAAWTIDLSSPNGKKAYNEIFGFSSIRADAYAKIDGSGVSKAEQQEISVQSRFDRGVAVFGQKIFLNNLLRLRTNGVMKDSSGRRFDYVQKELGRVHRDLLDGEREVRFCIVQTQDLQGEPKTFFELRYFGNNWSTKAEDVRSFVNFASLLEVNDARLFKPHVTELPPFRSLISKSDNSEESIDLFFTDEGIRDIDICDYVKARDLYVECELVLDPELKQKFASISESNWADSLALMRNYLELSRVSFLRKILNKLRSIRDAEELEREYEALNPGRSLEQDAKYIKNAEERADQFGRQVADFSVRDLAPAKQRINVERFFTHIADGNGFKFRAAIAALARIAGPEDVCIHKLKFKTKAGSFEAKDEGSLTFKANPAIADALVV